MHKRVWLAAFKGSDEELLSRNIFYHPSSSLTPITAVNRSSQHLGAWQNLSDRSELRQQLCWVNYSLLNEQHLSHLSLSTEESLRDESKCKVSPCASASSHFYLLSSQMCWKKKDLQAPLCCLFGMLMRREAALQNQEVTGLITADTSAPGAQRDQKQSDVWKISTLQFNFLCASETICCFLSCLIILRFI